MAANKDISNTMTSASMDQQEQREISQNRHYEQRIRELEAENTRLRDKLAVDEIKLNLVMSCETQFMNPSTSKALTDLKSKLAEKETVISQLKKRLRSEDRSNTILSQRDACDAVVDLCENHFQCAVCNELLVKATGLGCGHIFCRDCVNKWKKKSESTMNATTFLGKRATCPICRSEITMQSALKNIDSFLERAVDIFFNDDAKKSRKELLSTVAPSTSTATSIRLLTSGLSLPSTTPSTSSSTVRLVPSGSFLPSTSSGSRRPLNYGFLGPAFSLLADASADPALVIIDD